MCQPIQKSSNTERSKLSFYQPIQLYFVAIFVSDLYCGRIKREVLGRSRWRSFDHRFHHWPSVLKRAAAPTSSSTYVCGSWGGFVSVSHQVESKPLNDLYTHLPYLPFSRSHSCMVSQTFLQLQIDCLLITLLFPRRWIISKNGDIVPAWASEYSGSL